MNLYEYNENLIITNIEKYLSEFKYKNNGFKDISENLYPKYIENDDKNLIKLIKRLLIIYKRSHTKLLHKMIQKWQIITLKLKFNIEKELEEPKLEKNPYTYSKMINQKKNNIKKITKSFKKKNENDAIKSQTFEDLISMNDKEIFEENQSKLIENDKTNDYINNSIKSDFTNKMEINKSKSVDKFKNINFKLEKPKKWEYSYYRKKNNDKEITYKNKKKLMTDIERQQLFNDLYNDCKKRKEKYQQLKMEKEAKFNTLYTFTPKIIQNKLNEKYQYSDYFK